MGMQLSSSRWFKQWVMLFFGLVCIYFVPYYISHAHAANYYVSQSTGSDSSSTPGNSATPYKTIAKLNTITFSAGDNIYLKMGDIWAESFIAKGAGSSTNWITVNSYGSGNKPVLSPGTSAAYAIQMPTSNAGWKFLNLSINGAQAGISFLNKLGGGSPDGLWIENVDFTNITGAPVNPATNSSIPGMPFSEAIDIREDSQYVNKLTNVTIKNVNVTYSDGATDIRRVNGLLIDGLIVDHTYREGVEIESSNSGTLKNMKITYAAYRDGMYWGTAGLQFNECSSFTTQDSEIAYTQRANSSPDGVGVDFESNNANVSALRLNIHDNQGSAYLIYRNTSWGTDSLQTKTDITDNQIVNNGLYDSNTPAFLRVYENHYNTGAITGNTITKANASQSLNYLNDASPQNTELYPVSTTYSGYLFTASNNTNGYQASVGFSSSQGANNWSYQYWNGSTYTDMTWDSANSRWSKGGTYSIVGNNFQHPDASADSVRKFIAPQAGTITITGAVKKADTSSGDGVNVRIMKNGIQIWPASGWQYIAYNDGVGYNVNVSTSVAANDAIYFIVNQNGNNANDATTWDPLISYYGSGTNYALNASVAASSSVENYGWFKSAAVDGQRSSVNGAMGYSSQLGQTSNHTEWLEIDLSSSQTFSQVVLYPRNDSGNIGTGFPIDFKIQVWNGTTWLDRVTQSGYAQPGNAGQSFTWGYSDYTNKVRIYATNLRQVGTDYMMQLAEVEINP